MEALRNGELGQDEEEWEIEARRKRMKERLEVCGSLLFFPFLLFPQDIH